MFTKEVIDILDNVSIGHVATSSKDGCPNIAIKGIAKYDPQKQTISFLELYNGKTEKNLEENSQVTVAVVDHDNFKGFQFKGNAKIITEGPEFDECAIDWELHKHNRFRERIKGNLSKYLKDGASEYNLPKPKCLVTVHVKNVMNLAPTLD